MNSQTTVRQALVPLLLCLLPCCLFPPAAASARDWQIEKRTVRADLFNFDGRVVVLSRGRGKLMRIPLEKLSDEDVAYVKNRVALKHSLVQRREAQVQTAELQRQRYLQESQLQMQTALFWKDWIEVWIVQFEAPSGFPFWVPIAARDSDAATAIAVSRNPGARLLWVQKLRRQYD